MEDLDLPLDGSLAPKLKAITDSLVQCCVCNNRFNDPRVIPCGHTICLSCLQEHTADLTPGSVFTCPECGTKNTVPEGGVEIFARNLLITAVGHLIQQGDDEEQEAGPQESAMVCINATEDNPHEDVITFCTECVERYCGECDSWHGNASATRDHGVIAIEELSDEQVRAAMINAVVPKCDRHSEKLALHCNHCKVSICTVCASGGHKGHDVEDIASAADKRRTFLGRAQASTNDYVEKLQAMKETLVATRAKADEDRDMAQKWIEHTCNEIIRQANEQKEQMSSQVQEFFDDIVQNIDASLEQFAMQTGLAKKMIAISNSLHNDYNANTHAAGLSRKLREIQMAPIEDFKWESDVFARQHKVVPLHELVGVIKAEKKVIPPPQQDSGTEASEESIKPGESALTKAIDDIALKLELTSDKDVFGMTMIYRLVHLTHKKDPNIYIYQVTGALKTQVEIPELVAPQAMTAIDPDQGKLAIVCSSKNNLHLLTLSRDHQLEDQKTVKLAYLPQDINYDPEGDSLLVGRMNNIINILDRQGEVKRVVNCADVPWAQSSVAVSEGFIVTDHKANQVVRCNDEGETLNRYKYPHPFGPFKQGNKTAVRDQHGNVFVCDAVNSAIHLLTSEGGFIPFLLTPEQGVKGPTCICLDEVSQYIYLADTDEETQQKEVSAYPYPKLLLLLNMPLSTCKYNMKLTINKVEAPPAES